MGSLIKNDTMANERPDAVYLIDCESEIRAKCLGTDDDLSPEEQAQRIVAQAESRAVSILESARMEAESIRASAKDEGYRAGHAEWDERKQAMEQQIEGLEADAERQTAEHWSALEPELLALAVEVAKKIVRHEVDEHQDYILSAIKTALYQLRDKREIKLHLNASDYEFLKERKDELRGSFDGLGPVEMIEDRRIEKGGVLIESPSGQLDARLESQFAEVERTLMETTRDG